MLRSPLHAMVVIATASVLATAATRAHADDVPLETDTTITTAPTPPTPTPTPAPAPVAAPATTSTEVMDTGSSGGGQTAAGVVLTVLGVGGLAATGWLGTTVKSKYEESSSHCVADVCDSDGLAIRKSAHDRANLTTAIGVASGVVLLTGIIVWATAPSSSHESASASLRFTGTGFALTGRF
jgi:hypothetical protein